MPPVIPARLHRRVSVLRACGDDDMPDAGELLQRLVSDGFHGHGFAAPQHAVSGKQRFGTGVFQPGDDRRGAVAAEQRQDDAADAGDGQKGDHQLGNHRHVQADSVAFAESERAQGIGAAIYLAVELFVSQRQAFALFALPDECRRLPHRRALPFVQAADGDVHLPADAPARQARVLAGVEYPAVWLLETDVELLDDSIPEPGDVRG